MGNICTAKRRKNSGQQRSNLTTEQSNNSRQQRSNLTTEQSNNSRQQRSNLKTKQIKPSEKCYDPQDRTLTFVNGEDEMDFLCNDYKSLRAKMSCGHAVTPMSLTDWCRRLLDQGKWRFVCGHCDAEWSFEEVRKMALLTPEEVEEFEKKTFVNAAPNLKVKECPGCKSRVMRTDLDDLSVICKVCTAKRKNTYIFCWQCLREWKGPVLCTDYCDNDGCQSPLGILKTCGDVVLKGVMDARGCPLKCPSTRACPTCGMLVGHDGTLCKNVVCRQCKVEFCFVCLKTTEECQKLNPGTWFRVCSSGVAPRQTSIPVWQHR
ncbi:E3 ubiquitin-protein ligase arih1l-like isoform X2 [Sparus aurata]|uniref:E3 ubiquitin-protein ligase arih1l-like isoform X2 n=1 Tax=Sparus aurata TaxID=8175 RepID=UPI0011C177D1|nr:E3 ubiquitin-protein ligase arih1l-like isoform X2 [Sparus aurata]